MIVSDSSALTNVPENAIKLFTIRNLKYSDDEISPLGKKWDFLL